MELKVDIDKLSDGDEGEFKKLYQIYFPHFLSFALSYVNREDICNDIVQEVFISYWENRENFIDIVSLKVYFYRFIRNRCLNELRHTEGKVFCQLKDITTLESTDFLEKKIIEEETSLFIRNKIADLSPQEQKVLHLALEGKSNKEIAELLSISINTVKTHKLKAYSQLRIKLQDIQYVIQIIATI
jgi:RNA polymerase sigma-70 factor (ECF subfamily)